MHWSYNTGIVCFFTIQKYGCTMWVGCGIRLYNNNIVLIQCEWGESIILEHSGKYL